MALAETSRKGPEKVQKSLVSVHVRWNWNRSIVPSSTVKCPPYSSLQAGRISLWFLRSVIVRGSKRPKLFSFPPINSAPAKIQMRFQRPRPTLRIASKRQPQTCGGSFAHRVAAFTTGCPRIMTQHRKWTETKQQPSQGITSGTESCEGTRYN